MPEGDTIHTLAAAIRAQLAGQTLLKVRMRPEPRGHFKRGGSVATPGVASAEGELEGRVVRDVYALGKHLFMALDDGLLLRSHLGMFGTWHRYGPAEPWQKPAWRASLALWTDRDVFVCFNAKELEVLKAGSIDHDNLVKRLGPDLLAPDFDLSAVIRRARELCAADAPLVDVLLDQRIACGIGNVYKSEVLFIEAQHPLGRLRSMGDEALGRLYATARSLLQRNLGGGPRVTRWVNDGRGGLWVYGRRAAPCLRCPGEVQYARLGADMRPTYWCPDCQRGTADQEPYGTGPQASKIGKSRFA